MAISDDQKLGLLWKKYRSVTPTSELKNSANEQFLHHDPLFQQNFWTDSDRIPKNSPNISAPTGNELWFGVVNPMIQRSAIRLVVDPTSNNAAWVAVQNPVKGINDENRIVNWIPDHFDRSYTIRVWASNPGDPDSVNITRLYSTDQNNEWVFDYASGVLYFPNNVPRVALQQGIWIEGWQYIGEIGRESQNSNNSNTSKIRTLSFTTGILDPGAQADFTLTTGGKCVLVESKVDNAATLECHATSARTDTNPYRFVAINTHLIDDGSYIVNGARFYGDRFVNLINMEDTTSSDTYWRVQNDTNKPTIITVIVRVA